MGKVETATGRLQGCTPRAKRERAKGWGDVPAKEGWRQQGVEAGRGIGRGGAASGKQGVEAERWEG